MRARKTQTAIRQEQIAATALELMARHGPKALNLERLAQKVGVVPSAIYRHFSGKDAVLEAVLELIAQRLQDNVQAVQEETPEALERLHRLLRRHVQLIYANMAIPRVIFSEEIFNGNPKRRQHVHRIIREYLDAVTEFIRQGQQEGTVWSEVPADTASVMFLGILHPAVILWLTGNGAFDLGAHAEQAWCLFRQVLQTQTHAPGRLHRISPPESSANNQTR